MLGKLVSLFGFLLRIALSGIIMRNASTRAAPQNMPAQPLKSVDTGTPANELLTQMLNAGKIEPQEREQLHATALAVRERNWSKQKKREQEQRQQQEQQLVEDKRKLEQSTKTLENDQIVAAASSAAASAAERRDNEAARKRARAELAWERKEGDSLIRFMRCTFENDEKAMATMLSAQAEQQAQAQEEAEAAQRDAADKLEKELRALGEVGGLARDSYWSKMMLQFPQDLAICPQKQEHWTPTLSEVTHAVDLEHLGEVDRTAWARRDITYRRAMHKPHRRRSLKSPTGARPPGKLNTMLQSVPQSVQLSPPSTAEGNAVRTREQASALAAGQHLPPANASASDSSAPASATAVAAASDSVSASPSVLEASATVSLAPTLRPSSLRETNSINLSTSPRTVAQIKDRAEKRAHEESRRWVDSLEVLAATARERESNELRQRVAKAGSLAAAAECKFRQRAQAMQTEHAQSKRRWQTEASLSRDEASPQTSQAQQWVCRGEEATTAQSAYTMKLMLQYPNEGLIEPDRSITSDHSNVSGRTHGVQSSTAQQRKAEKAEKAAQRRRQQLAEKARRRAQQRQQEKRADEEREAATATTAVTVTKAAAGTTNANNEKAEKAAAAIKDMPQRSLRRRSSARAVTAKKNILEEAAARATADAQVLRRVQDDKEQGVRRRRISGHADAKTSERAPANEDVKIERNEREPPVQERPKTADKQAQIAIWREERLKHEDEVRRQEQGEQERPLMSAGAALLAAGLAKKMRRKIVQVQRLHVSFEADALGLRLAQYQAAPIAHRFRVDFVKPGGAAAALGVRAGDSLEKVGGRDLYALGVDADLQKMVRLLATAPRPLVLSLLRSGSSSDAPSSVPTTDASENQQTEPRDPSGQVGQVGRVVQAGKQERSQKTSSQLRARMAIAAKVIAVAKSFQPAFSYRFVDVQVPPGPLGMQMAEVSKLDMERALEFKRTEEEMAEEANDDRAQDTSAMAQPVSATPSRCRVFKVKPVDGVSEHPLSACLDPAREPTFLVAVDGNSVELLPVDAVVRMLLDKAEQERSLRFAVLVLNHNSSALSSPANANSAMRRAPEEPLVVE